MHRGSGSRLLTAGARVSSAATTGAGIGQHPARASKKAPDALGGVDPYFSLELALGFNYRQFLGELGFMALIDGSTSLQKGFSDASNRALTSDLGTTLPMVGIALRGGFSQWRPAR